MKKTKTKRWFTSDHHFNNRNIIGYCNRPYTDPDHMDAELAKSWRELVGVDDEVWLLGDICMGDKRKSLPLLKSLPGVKHLIIGNHDDPFDYDDDAREMYLEFFDTVQYTAELTIGGETVNLCHFPYLGDSTRFEEYRLEDDGRILICGHVHDAWQTKGRMINVGVDCWNYKPVSEREIIEVMRRV